MSNLEIERQKAAEADEREREEQRQYAMKVIINTHKEYWGAGKRRFKMVQELKDRIRTLITKDPGGTWLAGELLKQQIAFERKPATAKPKCEFRFEKDLYQMFVDAVAEQADALLAYDEPTYNDDVANAALIKTFLEEGESDDASIQN